MRVIRMMNPRIEKKQIKDVITLTTDLFGYIDYDLANLEVTKETLNFYFISKYSNRWVSPVLELLMDSEGEISTSNFTTLGTYINQLYKNKWDRMKNIIFLEYDPIHNYSDSMAEEIIDNDDKTVNLDLDGTKSNTRTDNLASSTTNTRTDNLSSIKSISEEDISRKTDNYIVGENYENTETNANFSERDNAIYGLDADGDPANADFAYKSDSGSVKKNNYGTTEKNETITNNATNTKTDNTANTGTVTNVGSVTNTGTVAVSGTNTTDGEEVTNRDYTRERSVTHIGNIGNIATQDLLEKEVEFWQWNFIVQMLSDVADVITLPIY